MRKSWFHVLFILVAALISVGGICPTSQTGEAAGETAGEADSSRVYQRHRHGQAYRYRYDNHDSAGIHGYHGYHGTRYYSPRVSGSWYARPYPYHFDYYRQRYGGGYAAPTEPADCPCAATP